jgi:hypothetical protein
MGALDPHIKFIMIEILPQLGKGTAEDLQATNVLAETRRT